jgi:hypothetical protein
LPSSGVRAAPILSNRGGGAFRSKGIVRSISAFAGALKSTGELGFVAAEDRDYDNYRKFYRATQVK